MFKTTLVSKKPSLADSGLLKLRLNPGRVEEAGELTFVSHSSSSSMYQVLKTRHTGSYFIIRKLLIVIALYLIVQIGSMVFWFAVTHIRPDFHLVGKSVPVVTYGQHCFDSTFVHVCTDSGDSGYTSYRTVKAWESYADWKTWAKNIVRGVIGLAALWYAFMVVSPLMRQLETLYRDLRIRFARPDDSILTRTRYDGYWAEFKTSLRRQINPSSFTPDVTKRSRLGDMLKQIRELTTETFGKASTKELNSKVNELDSQVVTPGQVVDLLTELLHKGERTPISLKADAAYSNFRVNIKRLIEQKQGASPAQKAKLEARIAELADLETSKLAPQLATEIYDRRINAVVIEADSNLAKLLANDAKDSEVNGVIASTNYLLNQA